MYTEAHYAKSRLIGTIVRVNLTDEPIYIENVYNPEGSDVIEVKCRNIYTKDSPKLTYRLSELNLKPVRLGYVNDMGRAYYLTRMPMRRDWRQGLRANNMKVVNGISQPNFMSIINTIKNIYPSYGVVIDTRDMYSSRAFCREFSVATDNLLYKGRSVGKIGEDDMPILNEKSQHLKELLEENT